MTMLEITKFFKFPASHDANLDDKGRLPAAQYMAQEDSDRLRFRTSFFGSGLIVDREVERE